MRLTGHYKPGGTRKPPNPQPTPGSADGTRRRLGGYREYAAPPALALCCESLWTHDTPPGPAVERAAHRVLPDLGLSLAFQGFRRDDGEPFDWTPVIIGPKVHAQIYHLVPGRELAAIRIKAEWVGPLLGIDPMSIEDRVDDLGGVMPRLAERLGEALGRTRSAAAALCVLAARIEDLRAACRTEPSAITSAALDAFRGTGGTRSCNRVASALGLSDRHMRRHVHDATGIAPKTYARAVRFVSAMLIADRSDKPVWADVALRAGYCDQSHLIRDSLAHATIAPRDLHIERRTQRLGRSVADLSNQS